MIPTNYDDDDEEDDMTGFEVENDPSFTYAMQIGTIEKDSRIFLGKADGEDANRQAILKILNTERYENVIYSWNYGVEFLDLFGEPVTYVCPEIKRRIEEALMQDGRIRSVDGFEFDTSKKHEVMCTFCVHTIFGDILTGKEVSI